MIETTSIVLPQTSALEVDSSVIDTSEVTSQADKDFLTERGTQILKVVAKAALLVGQQLCEIQDHFKTPDNPKGVGLGEYYKSLGMDVVKASQWSNKYRAYCAYVEIFGENEKAFNTLGDRAASRIFLLPTEYREALLADIAIGITPTDRQVEEIATRPEVKLSKAEELLAAAKARKEAAGERWEAIKSDPETPASTDGEVVPEYKKASDQLIAANRSVERFEQQIADLQAEVEAEKLRTAEENEEKSRLQTELQRLKYDDASARTERIKRVGSSLTMSVPQTLADIQKFFAEKDEYPEEVRHHLVEQATILANYIGDQL